MLFYLKNKQKQLPKQYTFIIIEYSFLKELLERITVNNMTKKQIDTISKSIKQVLPYELFFLLGISLLIVPGFVYIGDLIINKHSFSTLNFLYISFLIVFLFIALLFNKIALIIMVDRVSNNKSIKSKEVISQSISKLLSYLNYKNISSIVLYLLFIPFLYFTIFGYVTIYILKLYDIELDLILSLIIAYVLLVLLFFKNLYFCNYMVIENKNKNKAVKASTNLIKGNITKNISNILVIHLVMVIGLLLIASLYKILFSHNLLNTVTNFNTIMFTVFWVFTTLAISLYTTSINSSIGVMFNNYKREKHELFKNNKSLRANNWLIIPKLCKYTFILFSVILIYDNVHKELSYEPPKPINTEITAHRGFSMVYPENTMAALKGAKEEDAKWIEVDVQKTSDGQYVIFHDDDLNRITGYYGHVADLRLADLRTLDYGSYFDQKYSGEKIPLLSEVLDYSKKNKLNVILDLKNDWENIDYYEKDIIDMINRYNYANHCVIETPFYKQIRNIKRIDSKIKTAYLVAMPTEEVFDLTDADIISIDSININSYWINNIHNAGKKVYVWTPNDEEQLRQLLTLEIDNIITDNVEVALELKNNDEETTNN